MDACSESDPMVGVMFKNDDGDWVPYARTEVLQNQTKGIFARRIVIPGDRNPEALARQLALVLFDHDTHFGVQECVTVDNEIVNTGDLVKLAKPYKLRKKLGSDCFRRHMWLSLYFGTYIRTKVNTD